LSGRADAPVRSAIASRNVASARRGPLKRVIDGFRPKTRELCHLVPGSRSLLPLRASPPLAANVPRLWPRRAGEENRAFRPATIRKPVSPRCSAHKILCPTGTWVFTINGLSIVGQSSRTYVRPWLKQKNRQKKTGETTNSLRLMKQRVC
jgi:hypothetical protein